MSLPTFIEFTTSLRLNISELKIKQTEILGTRFEDVVNICKVYGSEQTLLEEKKKRHTKTNYMSTGYIEEKDDDKLVLTTLVERYNKNSELITKLTQLLLETSEENYIQVILDNSSKTKSLEHLANRIKSSKESVLP